MTLQDKISLIDQMIRENPDYTIRDYLDLMKELDRISATHKFPAPKFYHHTITTNDHYRKTQSSLRFYSRRDS